MGIARNTGDNLGGIRQLWIARKSKVAGLFARNTLTLTKAQLLTLFDELQFKVGDALPQRPTRNNEHGPYREFRLVLQVDKQSAEKDQLLESYEGLELVAIGLDHHSTYHLFGQPDCPITFTSDLDYGAQPAEGQKYTLQFTGNLPLKTPVVVIL